MAYAFELWVMFALWSCVLTSDIISPSGSEEIDDKAGTVNTLDDVIESILGKIEQIDLAILQTEVDKEYEKDEFKDFIENGKFAEIKNHLKALKVEQNKLLKELKLRDSDKLSEKEFSQQKQKLVDFGAKFNGKRVKFDIIDRKTQCKLKTLCFKEKLSDTQSNFVEKWEKFQREKVECKGFSSNCVARFRSLKNDFETIGHEDVPFLLSSVQEIVDDECFAKAKEQSDLKKGLLTLNVGTKGMIMGVQLAQKDSLDIELKYIGERFHVNREKFNTLKVLAKKAKSTKDDLSKVLEQIKNLSNNTSQLQSKFSEVYENIQNLEGWLLPEDFKHCSKVAGKFSYTLAGLGLKIKESLADLGQRFRLESFARALEGKQEEFKSLCQQLEQTVEQMKSGSLSLCANTDSTLKIQVETINSNSGTFKASVAKLLQQLNDDFKDYPKYETSKSLLTDLDERTDTHIVVVKKHVYFLNIYNALYCKPQMEEDKQETEEEDGEEYET